MAESRPITIGDRVTVIAEAAFGEHGYVLNMEGGNPPVGAMVQLDNGHLFGGIAEKHLIHEGEELPPEPVRNELPGYPVQGMDFG